MWSGRNKAVTFSFDDGVLQDVRFIEILNKYGLKGTFNLNSGLFGQVGSLDRNGKTVRHDKVLASEVKEIYKGHEVAVHTLTHPNLTEQTETEIIRQVNEDKKVLSSLVGYEVQGMAYPCGGVNNDERVAKIIREATPIKYARTITSTYNFDLQENVFRFNPTVHCIESCLNELVDRFLSLKTEKPQLLYIWGHTYEMDAGWISWEAMERVCKTLSGRKDIFYGTNSEVLL